MEKPAVHCDGTGTLVGTPTGFNGGTVGRCPDCGQLVAASREGRAGSHTRTDVLTLFPIPPRRPRRTAN